MQRDPRLGIEPRTFLLQGNSATNCATVQASIPPSILIMLTWSRRAALSSLAFTSLRTYPGQYVQTLWSRKPETLLPEKAEEVRYEHKDPHKLLQVHLLNTC
ncbi:hypothetical protein ATANTOWER_008517 [Ataeniobius toweri]|uniref:Uncharacterized protein n=1 Tax=Ataeniobius toweri TaxID=208326 RepID=A0ABU7BL10_9TELE|nr:hypothetical protein [Ataeniobius toweri]